MGPQLNITENNGEISRIIVRFKGEKRTLHLEHPHARELPKIGTAINQMPQRGTTGKRWNFHHEKLDHFKNCLSGTLFTEPKNVITIGDKIFQHVRDHIGWDNVKEGSAIPFLYDKTTGDVTIPTFELTQA